MNARTRATLEEAVLTVGLMLGASYTYYIIAIWGLSNQFAEGVFKDYATGPGIHWELLITGVCFGGLMAVVNRWTESRGLRRRPFGHIILIKTGAYLICLVLAGVLVNIALLAFVFTSDQLVAVLNAMTGRLWVALAGWLVTTIVGVNFLLEVRRKVGPGNLLALMTGRYHKPRNEEHVFLFLDLKSSTSIAESLGHERYSQLLRQCYHDLTDVVLRSGARIYQYVGDEVVLTWPADDPGSGSRCLKAFFMFSDTLRSRRDTYRDLFGVAPEFRGGTEMGTVTATEVGDIKRDIAYHGDPLNTAARLLELCKESEAGVLISGRIQRAVSDASEFATTWVGDLSLRGKEERVPVYEVARREAFAA